MRKKFLTAVLLTVPALQMLAQVSNPELDNEKKQDNASFVFTQSHLGED